MNEVTVALEAGAETRWTDSVNPKGFLARVRASLRRRRTSMQSSIPLVVLVAVLAELAAQRQRRAEEVRVLRRRLPIRADCKKLRTPRAMGRGSRPASRTAPKRNSVTGLARRVRASTLV